MFPRKFQCIGIGAEIDRVNSLPDCSSCSKLLDRSRPRCRCTGTSSGHHPTAAAFYDLKHQPELLLNIEETHNNQELPNSSTP